DRPRPRPDPRSRRRDRSDRSARQSPATDLASGNLPIATNANGKASAASAQEGFFCAPTQVSTGLPVLQAPKDLRVGAGEASNTFGRRTIGRQLTVTELHDGVAAPVQHFTGVRRLDMTAGLGPPTGARQSNSRSGGAGITACPVPILRSTSG